MALAPIRLTKYKDETRVPLFLRSGLFLCRISLLSVFWLAFTLTPACATDAPAATVRVGVLKFGTVNWELDVIQAHAMAQKNHVNLVVIPLASADASTIALQGGAVDVVVSDWIWVTRQRSAGAAYSFVPFSNALGSLMVKAGGPLRSVADLKGRTIGVSGGPNDKTWLLLRAYASSKFGLDLTKDANPVFTAPPLLNELAMSQQVDAALNVWHYDAQLEASGMVALIGVPELLAGLGINKPIPLIGWVFREDWAAQNTKLLQNFLASSMQAKDLMLHSDAEWERLRPLVHATDNTRFLALRDGYRRGIPVCADSDYSANVAATFRVLAQTGGEKLVGKSTSLAEGTFWPGFALPVCPKK